ncbi:MAG TPA: glycerol-3-phosphate dehydrogenase [Methylocella sp.]|jgi:glycerol-3-phosphate dehydrogenase|nr:glycerol-3-phosphate dehydrogenase [Methylocella sp.]
MEKRINVDLLVIGGGVNGAGIARDAAGRGLSVMLCEQGDLADATSSASSKLIHGGLRYLEYYQFRFVREALLEREVLLAIAPHIVWPARFILPHDKGLRPALVIEAGLFLYDWLARRNRLGRSRRLDLRPAKEGAPLKDRLTTGFAYSDCRVDDARLVVLNAVDARERGASIRTRTRCVSAKREHGMWQATLLDMRVAATTIVTARALVNAAGPWAAEVFNGVTGHDAGKKLRLVKGSHIVVPRMYEGDQSYVLQNEDRRVIFVMPYEMDYTLIGTTEIPFEGDPSKARISVEEISYLCAAVSRYFRKPLRPCDVVESFSGVRPLYDDGAANASAAARAYVLDLDAPEGSAPLLSVFGGKITTYRRLAEDALELLSPHLKAPYTKRWTATAPLPGGDMESGDFDLFLRTLRGKYPWLDAATVARLARAYGTRVEMILGKARSADDLGVDFGAGLFQAEIDYLIGQEFALAADDILWRRSKRGLHLSPVERARVSAYLDTPARGQIGPAFNSIRSP